MSERVWLPLGRQEGNLGETPVVGRRWVEQETPSVRGVVVVFGGDPARGVPTLWGDVAGTPALGPVEESSERQDSFAVEGASHVTLITRPEWEERTRAAVTVLRAHDPDRHVSVLPTQHVPLGATLVAALVNDSYRDPALQHAAAVDLLGAARSGLWVRSAGRLPRRVPLGLTVSSWWRRSGNLAVGEQVGRAQAEDWSRLTDGTTSFRTAGHVPEAAVEQLTAAGVTPESVARQVSPGAADLSGQPQAFEFAWLDPGSVEPPRLAGAPCSSCGVTVEGTCPFCRASWGPAPTADESDAL